MNKRKSAIPAGVVARYGKWTVIDGNAAPPSGTKGDLRRTFYLVECECGARAILRADKLRSGVSRQCKACRVKKFAAKQAYHSTKQGRMSIARLRREGWTLTPPKRAP